MINKNKKYKALMLDLDGTTISNGQFSVPSKKVREAIEKAKKKLHVCIVTARRFTHAKYIIDILGLNGPSILSGGAEIRQSKTGKILWSKQIPAKISNEILRLFENEKYKIWIDDNDYYLDISEYDPSHPPRDVLQMSVVDVPISKAEFLIKSISRYSTVVVHKTSSWDYPDNVWLCITHNEASKQHGIFEVAKLLGIEAHEIIGIGDGYNDFPLLMACGLRVAMGNAVAELKEIADYIAPTVEEDGVADVIEKFIL